MTRALRLIRLDPRDPRALSVGIGLLGAIVIFVAIFITNDVAQGILIEIGAVAIGVPVTILIIEQLIKNSEQRRWKRIETVARRQIQEAAHNSLWHLIDIEMLVGNEVNMEYNDLPSLMKYSEEELLGRVFVILDTNKQRMKFFEALEWSLRRLVDSYAEIYASFSDRLGADLSSKIIDAQMNARSALDSVTGYRHLLNGLESNLDHIGLMLAVEVVATRVEDVIRDDLRILREVKVN